MRPSESFWSEALIIAFITQLYAIDLSTKLDSETYLEKFVGFINFCQRIGKIMCNLSLLIHFVNDLASYENIKWLMLVDPIHFTTYACLVLRLNTMIFALDLESLEQT